MLKLKLQYFGHLMPKNWLIGKDPDAGKDWRQEEKGVIEDEMVGGHHWLNGHEFEQAPGVDGGGEAWRAAVHGVAKSQTQPSDWIELSWYISLRPFRIIYDNMEAQVPRGQGEKSQKFGSQSHLVCGKRACRLGWGILGQQVCFTHHGPLSEHFHLRSHLESSSKTSTPAFCNTLCIPDENMHYFAIVPSLQKLLKGRMCLEYLKRYHIYPLMSSQVIWNSGTKAYPYLLDTNNVAFLSHLPLILVQPLKAFCWQDILETSSEVCSMPIEEIHPTPLRLKTLFSARSSLKMEAYFSGPRKVFESARLLQYFLLNEPVVSSPKSNVSLIWKICTSSY